MTRPIDIGALVALLAQRMPELVSQLRLKGEREGREFVALNPTRGDSRPGSFSICLEGANAGLWAEFAGDARGDALDLIAYVNGSDKKAALAWARAFLGLDDSDPAALKATRRAQQQAAATEKTASEEAARNQRRAFKLWLDGQPRLKGTPAELYLRGRRIDFRRLGRQPGALRYNPRVFNREADAYLPAMLAVIVNESGQHISVHRTWLARRRDGVWDKAPLKSPKKTYGRFAGGAIRLWRGDRIDDKTGEVKPGVPVSRAPAGSRLVLTEGIEDALTVAMAAPDQRIWAAISVSNMARLILPEVIGEVVICADADAPGSSAAATLERAIFRFQREGRRVRIAPPPRGKDMNDTLTSDQKSEVGSQTAEEQ